MNPEDASLFAATAMEIAKNVVPVEHIKRTFGDIWDLVIGTRIGLKAEMGRLDAVHEVERRKLQYAYALEEYRQRIEQKLNAIPAERLIDADLSTVGPALEASKYYVERKELRELFANLIAHACDKQYEDKVHPGYVEILRQLSPLEADLLSCFRPKTLQQVGVSMGMERIINGEVVERREPEPPKMQPICYHYPETIFPIVEYSRHDGQSAMILQRDVLLRNLDDSVERMSASVANLRKLGLIETAYDGSVPDGTKYTIFTEHPWYKRLNEEKNTIRFIRGHLVAGAQNINLRKGYAKLTQFGYNFISVCVLDEETIMVDRH